MTGANHCHSDTIVIAPAARQTSRAIATSKNSAISHSKPLAIATATPKTVFIGRLYHMQPRTGREGLD